MKDNVSLIILNGGPSYATMNNENPVIPPRKMATSVIFSNFGMA